MKNKQIQTAIGVIVGMLIVFGVRWCGKSDNSNSKDYSSRSKSETYVGTYTTTDAVGTKLTFTLSEDGTVKCEEEYKTIFGVANSYSKTNEFGDYKQTATKTHYGHWEELTRAVPCQIKINNGPNIYFNANDAEYGYRYLIKNGYLYTDEDDCKSAHPERRLKLTKLQ